MSHALRHTVQQLLRPLVRYAIAQGFTFTAFVDLLKTLYVDEALHREPGRRTTDSDLSLMTGIHRKDVKRLRGIIAEPEELEGLRRGTHVAAQLIGTWASSDDMRDPSGNPRRLPLRSTSEPSFEDLTRRIKADVRPRAILDDLIRARAVAVDDDGRIRLLRSAYVPDVPEEKLRFLAQNVGDHIACAFHNLGDNPPFLERALYLDALTQKDIEAARPRIEAAANRLLQDLHKDLIPLECSISTDPNARRMRVGIYYYEDAPVLSHENFHDSSL